MGIKFYGKIIKKCELGIPNHRKDPHTDHIKFIGYNKPLLSTISHINEKQDCQSAHKRNIQARSRNHYCPLKAINTSYPEYLFAAFLSSI
jgi:hypothetical protein